RNARRSLPRSTRKGWRYCIGNGNYMRRRRYAGRHSRCACKRIASHCSYERHLSRRGPQSRSAGLMRSLVNRVTGCSSTFTCITLQNYIFELQGPVRRSMCRQYPVARPLAEPLSFRLRKARKYIGHFIFVVGKKNFLAWSEEIVQTLPSIRKNCGSTGRGFKQSDGRRVARGYHALAREIKRKSRGGIKRWMTARRN